MDGKRKAVLSSDPSIEKSSKAELISPAVFGDDRAAAALKLIGKLSDLASAGDIARGIINLVGETVGMLAVFAARHYGLDRVVLTGTLTAIESIRDVFAIMERSFGIRFIIPEFAQYGTVIGAALSPQ